MDAGEAGVGAATPKKETQIQDVTMTQENTTGTHGDVVVSRHDEASLYEAHVDGELAGFAEFALDEGLITLTHTEVFPAFEGRGVGSALARFALVDVRARGDRRVVPLCPFITKWIHHHPAYKDLVR